MAKIISFVTQKGGSGKTTLLMLTAAAIHNRTKRNVLVIDSDPQHSVKKLYTQENNKTDSYDVFAFNWKQPKSEINFQKTIKLAEAKYDVILMDVPGRLDGKEVYFSVLISDILIVPIIASTLDITATIEFLNYLPELKSEKEKQGYLLDVFGVVNKRDKSMEHKYLKDLVGLGGLEMFYSPISNLVRYKRYISTIHDITDYSQKGDEFNMYFDEFRTKCGI